MPIGLFELWLLGLVVLMAYFVAVEIFYLRRYSLRSVMFVMTVLAIILGLATAFVRG